MNSSQACGCNCHTIQQEPLSQLSPLKSSLTTQVQRLSQMIHDYEGTTNHKDSPRKQIDTYFKSVTTSLQYQNEALKLRVKELESNYANIVYEKSKLNEQLHIVQGKPTKATNSNGRSSQQNPALSQEKQIYFSSLNKIRELESMLSLQQKAKETQIEFVRNEQKKFSTAIMSQINAKDRQIDALVSKLHQCQNANQKLTAENTHSTQTQHAFLSDIAKTKAISSQLQHQYEHLKTQNWQLGQKNVDLERRTKILEQSNSSLQKQLQKSITHTKTLCTTRNDQKQHQQELRSTILVMQQQIKQLKLNAKTSTGHSVNKSRTGRQCSICRRSAKKLESRSKSRESNETKSPMAIKLHSKRRR